MRNVVQMMKLLKIEHTPIIVEKLEKDLWKLSHPIVIRLFIEEAGIIRLKINPGFIFNFRSGSRFLNASIPKIDDFAVVWLYHDFGYNYHGLSRATWDDLMYQGLKLKGLSTWKSWIAYRGVRWGGEEPWYDIDERNKALCSLTWDDK
jgi:hypothetical protein